MDEKNPNIISELKSRFGETIILHFERTIDGIPTIWIDRNNLIEVLKYLKYEIANPFTLLYDLTAIDERVRRKKNGQPDSDFTVVYLITSFERNSDLRLKVALKNGAVSVPSITSVWESANWYEREVFEIDRK